MMLHLKCHVSNLENTSLSEHMHPVVLTGSGPKVLFSPGPSLSSPGSELNQNERLNGKKNSGHHWNCGQLTHPSLLYFSIPELFSLHCCQRRTHSLLIY